MEKRFRSAESVQADHRMEFLSGNGSADIAAGTRALECSPEFKPISTSACSTQSNGTPKSFVNTLKRDYISRMVVSNAATLLAQLLAAFEHFSELDPRSSSKVRSPRGFRGISPPRSAAYRLRRGVKLCCE